MTNHTDATQQPSLTKEQAAKTPSNTVTAHDFGALDLQSLGLNSDDFSEVVAASKELSDLDQHSVAEYGKNIAQKTSSYTDDLLHLVQNKDLDETGQKLNQVVSAAKQLNTQHLLAEKPKKSLLSSLFGKVKDAKQNFQSQFQSTKEQIEQLVKEIEQSQQGLKQRVEMLDKMYSAVQEEYRALGIYVAAGQITQKHIAQKMDDLTAQEQQQQTVQDIYDLNHTRNNLEKRVHDLQLLQQSALQTLPMIRIIQSNNLMLVDKFYAIKNITLPAWKNQISLALSLNEQKNSVELAHTIDNATNELLRRNAELLHSNSVNTAKANQRSVIDVETLEHVQNTLIKTVNDVLQIQKEGMAQREQATYKLKDLQQNLNTLVIDSATGSRKS